MSFNLRDSFQIFANDSKKMRSTVNTALTKTEIEIPEIVPIYYQIMTLNSLGELLLNKLQNIEEDDSMKTEITQTTKFISEKFNSKLHPFIMEYLSDSVMKISEKLKGDNSLEKSNDDIESQAKVYDILRQVMSTREFVEQYDKGLEHD